MTVSLDAAGRVISDEDGYVGLQDRNNEGAAVESTTTTTTTDVLGAARDFRPIQQDVEFRVLGPLEVALDGFAVHPLSEKPRRLLAVLLLHVNEVVSVDALVAGVWGEQRPATAVAVVQTYVSQLRKLLEPSLSAGGCPRVLVRAEPGYRLVVGGDWVDSARFEQLLRAGRAALGRGEVALAAHHLSEGLSLWRGPAFSDLAEEEPFRATAQRLDGLRVLALEERIDADMALGRHGELVSELEGLVEQHSFRERMWGQLILCLYRSGRQADALAAFQRLRRLLGDELGLAPSTELSGLEQQILLHAPELAWLLPGSTPGLPSIHEHGWRGSGSSLTNLPARPTRLIGREAEILQVRQLLAASRLVTVTAVGGSGKTRVAIAAGEAELALRPGGVWFVELAGVMNGVGVPTAIANAVGMVLGGGDPTDQVVRYLADKPALVIVDNCEHVIEACADFAERLLAVPGQAVLLATSREPLDLDGERVVVLGPLNSEDRESPAVQLFVDRATAVVPQFVLDDANASSIATLCARLDGIPLAIELAAARVTVMTPADLLAGLDDRFQMLSGGRRRTRQRTLESTLDWSYNLLNENEQRVFRALGVFVDGFDLAAVAAVTKAPLTTTMQVLEALVAKSLVVRIDHGDRTRFGLLETLTAYAGRRLAEAGEAALVRGLHLEHFHHLATVHGHTVLPELQLCMRLRPERNNLTAAYEWAASTGQWLAAEELVIGSQAAYEVDGHAQEFKTLIERAIQQSDMEGHEPADYLRGVLLLTLVWLNDWPMFSHTAKALRGSPLASLRAMGWTMLGLVSGFRDHDQSRYFLQKAGATVESVPASSRDRNIRIASGLLAYSRAVLAGSEGDYETALLEARHALAVEVANGYHTIVTIRGTNLEAACQILLGEPAKALETISTLDEFDLTFLNNDEIRALAYLKMDEVVQAERIIRSHALRAATGRISGEACDSALLLAGLAHAEGDDVTAVALLLHMGIGHRPATRMFSSHLAARLGVTAEHDEGQRRAFGYDLHSEPGPLGAHLAMTALRQELIRRGWNEPSGDLKRSPVCHA